MEIGMQLYSVRNYMHNVDELKTTLAKLRECGYTCVETAGIPCGLTVQEFNKMLKDADLKPISMHIGLDELVRNGEVLAGQIAEFGCKDICVPGIPGSYYAHTPAGFTAVAEILDIHAEKLAQQGVALS